MASSRAAENDACSRARRGGESGLGRMSHCWSMMHICEGEMRRTRVQRDGFKTKDILQESMYSIMHRLLNYKIVAVYNI